MSRDRTVGDTFFIAFTTRAFATGIPTVLAGTPVVSAYEDAGLTQITAGITLGVDHDGVVGMNMLTIVATGGNGFESGKDYNLALTAGTVGGVSVVGEIVGQFSLGLSAAAVDLANGTDGLTALKTGLDDVPTVSEFNARTLVAASYFDPAADAVANVTLTATTTAVTNQVTANMTAISGDSTAADNLEAMYDGSGYIDDTAPASRSQVDNISVIGGGAVNFNPESSNVTGAIKSITFVGVQTSGTFADTFTLNSVFHVIDDTTNEIDLVYSIDVTAVNLASEVIIAGFLNSGNDEMNILAYDFVGVAWEQIETLEGQGGSSNVTITAPLLVRHTGTTGADTGKVLIRIQNTGQSNPTLQIDRLIVQAVSNITTLGFVDGAVWVNTLNGTSGTAEGVGFIDNPSDNLADAYTIATANNLTRFQIATGSAVTLPATSSAREIMGQKYTVALNSADINGTTITGSSAITGIGNCSTTAASFFSCGIGDVTIDPCNGFECGFFGTFTLRSEGVYVFGGSAALTAPGLGMVIDFGSGLNASSWSMQSWGGGTIEVQNMGAGTGSYNMEASGWGDFTINANCSATSTVDLHGNFVLTNNASGITVTEDANYMESILVDAVLDEALSGHTSAGSLGKAVTDIETDATAILADTTEIGTAGAGLTDLGGMSTGMKAEVNVEADTALTDYDGPTNAEMEARTLVAASYFDPAADAVANVTLVATTTDVTNQVTANVTAISGDSAAADSLEASLETLVTGTATGVPTTTTMADSTLTEATDDHFNGRVIIWRTGALKQQATDITSYNGTTKTFTFTATTNAASAGDAYVIV